MFRGVSRCFSVFQGVSRRFEAFSWCFLGVFLVFSWCFQVFSGVFTGVCFYRGVFLQGCVFTGVCFYRGVFLQGCVFTGVCFYRGVFLQGCVFTGVCFYGADATPWMDDHGCPGRVGAVDQGGHVQSQTSGLFIPIRDQRQQSVSLSCRGQRGPSLHTREKGLEVMSDVEGPAVEAFRVQLKKAQNSRSEKRLAEIDAQRVAEVESLTEARARLERLRSETILSPHRLGNRGQEAQTVAELQCQKPLCSRVQASHPVQSSVEAVQMVQERAAKRRTCAEEVPSTEQALAEWLSGTQGCSGDWGSFSGGGVESTSGRWGSEDADTVWGCVHGGQFREISFLKGRSMREEAQHGLRASRVGEASHPGPPLAHSQQTVPADVLDALYDLSRDDSDSPEVSWSFSTRFASFTRGCAFVGCRGSVQENKKKNEEGAE